MLSGSPRGCSIRGTSFSSFPSSVSRCSPQASSSAATARDKDFKELAMKQKNFESILYSSAGVAVMFVLLLAFYVVSSAFKARIDLTSEKAFTLSPGTKKILDK